MASTTASREAPSRTPTCDRQMPEDPSRMAANNRGRCQRFWWWNRSKERNFWNDSASMVTEVVMGCNIDKHLLF